jgi:hypothetical protein
MDQDDRNALFEKALARQVRSNEGAERSWHGGSATTGDVVGCPHAEVIAAFHERALTAAEMVVVQGHVATCARCQETLGLLRATDSVALDAEAEKTPAAVTDISNVRRPKKIFKWVAPAGAIAAGLLIWIVARDNPRRMYSARSVEVAQEQRLDDRPNASASRPETDASPYPAPPPISTQKTENGKALQADAGSKHVGPREKQDSARQNSSSPTGAVGTLSRHFDRRDIDTLSGSPHREESKNPAAFEAGAWASGGLAEKELHDKKAADLPEAARNEIAITPKSEPSLGANQASPPERDELAKQKTKAAVPSAPAAAVPAASPTSDAVKDAAKPETTMIETDQGGTNPEIPTETIASSGNLERSSSPGFKTGRLKFAPTTVSAPGGATQWRFHAGGMIEHSSDAGKTWVRQNSGVTTELLAGSAASASVCWLAGRAGTILRTTDGGAHWSKVVGPFPGDINGISVADAVHATIVTGVPPARFSTNDGGVSWAPVQEVR